MRMKSLILIFIALGCGLVASIGISQVMDRGGSGGSLEMEQILVALAELLQTSTDDRVEGVRELVEEGFLTL